MSKVTGLVTYEAQPV